MRCRGIRALALLPLTASSPSHPHSEAIIAELNRVRADPARYADELSDYRRHFDGLVHRPPGDEAGMLTEEGAAAVDDAIAALRAHPPMPPIGHGEVLAAGAGMLAAEQASTGDVGHQGADGSDAGTRAKAMGGDRYVAESIAYGERGATAIVRQLIVDDAVPERGHRRMLLSRQYRFAGAWCGPHPRFRTMCVVDLARTPDGRP